MEDTDGLAMSRDGWKADAGRYAANADYWKARAKAAEANLTPGTPGPDELPPGIEIKGQVPVVRLDSRRIVNKWCVELHGGYRRYLATDGKSYEHASYADNKFWWATSTEAVSAACQHGDLPEGYKIEPPTEFCLNWSVYLNGVSEFQCPTAREAYLAAWNLPPGMEIVGTSLVGGGISVHYPTAHAAYLAAWAAAEVEPKQQVTRDSRCKKCGVLASRRLQKYCGDGSDKDNEHNWEPIDGTDLHEASRLYRESFVNGLPPERQAPPQPAAKQPGYPGDDGEDDLGPEPTTPNRSTITPRAVPMKAERERDRLSNLEATANIGKEVSRHKLLIEGSSRALAPLNAKLRQSLADAFAMADRERTAAVTAQAHIATLEAALREACELVESVAMQQAMPDDFYEEPLARLAALAKGGG